MSDGQVMWRWKGHVEDLKGRPRTRSGHHIDWHRVPSGHEFQKEIGSVIIRILGSRNQILRALEKRDRMIVTSSARFISLGIQDYKAPKSGNILSRKLSRFVDTFGLSGAKDHYRRAKRIHDHGLHNPYYVYIAQKMQDGKRVKGRWFNGPELAGLVEDRLFKDNDDDSDSSSSGASGSSSWSSGSSSSSSYSGSSSSSSG